MLSKLPRWVEYGAFTLALLAGAVNAIGLLGFHHQSVSHLSGTATMLGVGVAELSVSSLHLLGILLSFLAGSVISGFLLSGVSLKLGRHYDSLLLIEGIFLLVAVVLLQNQVDAAGQYFASAACGIQNALATTYSGAIIRTTHVTGIVTDLGLMIGSVIRGETFDKRKGILFSLIAGGFVLGGIVGALLFARFAFLALIFPSVVCFLLALVYRGYRARMLRANAAQ